jgi:hypothetical protein
MNGLDYGGLFRTEVKPLGTQFCALVGRVDATG